MIDGKDPLKELMDEEARRIERLDEQARAAVQFVRDIFVHAEEQGISGYVWQLLSALRGPDRDEDFYETDSYKQRFTRPIRKALGVVYFGRSIPPEELDICDDLTDERQKVSLSSGEEHFLSHIAEAECIIRKAAHEKS